MIIKNQMKIGSHTKNLKVIVISALMILTLPGVAAAVGLFGPPQPISKEEGGLHTGIGYWLHEDKFKNETEYVIRQNQIYSQVGYGAKNYWEIYARIGVSDLKVPDAFSSTNALTTTAKNDFEENWKFSGTLGAKGFYPINKIFGIGAFIQGTYIYSDFTDDVSGTQNGIPFTVELKVENLWDVNFGIGFQATGSIRCKAVHRTLSLLFGGERHLSPQTFPVLNLQAGMLQSRTRQILEDTPGSTYLSPRVSA